MVLGSSTLGLPGFQTKLGIDPPLPGDVLVDLFFGGWISTDSSLSLGMRALETVRGYTELDLPGKLLLVFLFILFRKVPREVNHVLPEDACSVTNIKRFSLAVISEESLLGVGDIQSSVHNSS